MALWNAPQAGKNYNQPLNWGPQQAQQAAVAGAKKKELEAQAKMKQAEAQRMGAAEGQIKQGGAMPPPQMPGVVGSQGAPSAGQAPFVPPLTKAAVGAPLQGGPSLSAETPISIRGNDFSGLAPQGPKPAPNTMPAYSEPMKLNAPAPGTAPVRGMPATDLAKPLGPPTQGLNNQQALEEAKRKELINQQLRNRLMGVSSTAPPRNDITMQQFKTTAY